MLLATEKTPVYNKICPFPEITNPPCFIAHAPCCVWIYEIKPFDKLGKNVTFVKLMNWRNVNIDKWYEAMPVTPKAICQMAIGQGSNYISSCIRE
jgi:hypothetical protein